MNTSRVFELMCRLKLVDWSAIALGWSKHWIDKGQVAAWSTSWLAKHPEDEGDAEVELAQAVGLDDSRVTTLLDRIGSRSKPRQDHAALRWRLAMLIDLATLKADWDEKVTELEVIAAEFGYPEDMRECTRYGPAGVDPLDAMASVVERLRSELDVDLHVT